MRICSCLLLLLLFSCSKKDSEPVKPVDSTTTTKVTTVLYPVTNAAINTTINGYYISLPSNYNESQATYPLLVFVPGAGQFGNGVIDLPLLLRDGPAQLADEGRLPGSFRVNGQDYSMMVFTPQCKNYPSPEEIRDCINYAKTKYRVDNKRIYLSGLSIGGIVTTNLAAMMPESIAALVPLAGIPLDYDSNSKCRDMAMTNLPVWAFHSSDDPVFNISWANGFIAKFNSYNSTPPARLTKWTGGGHDAWTRALDPLYKENGMNIYEWMLQYHR